MKLLQKSNCLKLARQANWSATTLAKLHGVSIRTLERFFKEQMGMNPRKWLTEQRQKVAAELLRDGSSVKETAAGVGYKHATHFSLQFQQFWGHSPTRSIRKWVS